MPPIIVAMAVAAAADVAARQWQENDRGEDKKKGADGPMGATAEMENNNEKEKEREKKKGERERAVPNRDAGEE